jgi:hypothetical protein
MIDDNFYRRICCVLALTVWLTACDAKSENPWRDPEFRRSYLSENIKSNYTITRLTPSPEEAVAALVEAASGEANASLDCCLMNQAEIERILWPNLPDTYTGNIYLSPDDYWRAEDAMRISFVPDLRRLSASGMWTVQSITWAQPPQQLNALRLHFPDEVVLRSAQGGRSETLDYIGVILEHNGGYKVAQLYRK